MKIREASILMMALVGLTCCGVPQEVEVLKGEIAKKDQTIEGLMAQIKNLEELVQELQTPSIKIEYFSKTGCFVNPFELTVKGNKVRFENDTENDATFTFPNPIFGDSVFTLVAGGAETRELAPGASEYKKTDYAVEAKCYSEPTPGPFILIP